MHSFDDIRRIGHERIERFHHEAETESHRASRRRRVAEAIRRIAAWIEPEALHPQSSRPRGGRYAAP